MQSIVDEGKSPISRFKIRRDIIDLSGSQHMFRADKVSSRDCQVILGVDWQVVANAARASALVF